MDDKLLGKITGVYNNELTGYILKFDGISVGLVDLTNGPSFEETSAMKLLLPEEKQVISFYLYARNRIVFKV